MTIIVFLIDTSASMLQRTYIGGRTTLLDVAKSAVETFVKIRQRSMDSRIDRYMLLTFEETPNNIKAGWKENLATFMNELKNLQCYSMTTMGVAVKQAFDILNINRMTSGIDTYGQGRCPFFLETSVIVLITDGGKLTTINGVHEEFNLPMHSPVPGSELTREPFRWDQRLFALVLRLTGTPAIERDTGLVPSDSSPIDAMCEVTGGRSYCITSHRMLNQCIDSLVQKVQNGVVINFEKIGPDPPPPVMEKGEDGKEESKDDEFDRMNPPILSTNWHNCRKMIYVPKSSKSYCVGFWPIPESFWPEVTASVLPARSAHPNIKFTCTNSEPLVIENLPFDKYELEPSPLTQYVLSRKQPKTCWQVFVANSYKNSEVGHPFGYLKASTNLSCVNLFVMPYNYPVLLPLLDELAKIHRWKPTNEWRTQFQNYLRTLPAYYAGPLRRALTRMGTPLALAQTLIPENSENLSYSVSNYLKRLKNQAKVEYDKLCSEITLRQNAQLNMKQNSEQIRVMPKVTLKKELISHPLLMDKFNAHRDQLLDQSNPFHVTLDKERQNVSFKNPFDIPRNRLVQQVVRMRNNFLQPDWISLDQDSAHSLPISQMGNYQEYLKRQTPQLREIESAPVRQHMFGNPFKIDKRMMVDEADIDLVASPGANRNNKRPIPNADMGGRLPLKRKPGPLPKNFSIRRPSGGATPPLSPIPMAPSPVPWTSVIEKELPSFDERPTLVTVNGLDSPSSSERSRSPSPTMDMPSYSVNEVNYARNSNPYSYTNSGALDTVTTNSLNDFYPSICDDKQSISQILKEANSVSVVANSQPEVKPKITAEDLQEIENQNNEIRKHLHKLVRRPGKNFTELFDNIKTLKGNIEIQVKMVELIIKESLRFKRQHLAHLLEEYIQNLLSCENK
ncbi:integrator complex subunit 6 [Tribolium castaneum]|uniref:Integrator complex subunit 6-A-like Protein n=1 Tax=Tribolium castaneum TaxID=7070 RepID=D2A291_TRICA|nr:PREDICTED: integrator complex subunit 6 [Tribolium castaneum]EFA02055.1 Integrator complex subunit 6-A-like Protein [Tribolium castaneum]|eukprot:XP_974396.1 PREDICTED: integrator complex subunit 6 [Tribolium castaneum]